MVKKANKKKDEGADLDDAFADDDDVEYAESKPRKIVKKLEGKKKNDEDIDGEEKIKIKGSKPITEVKKGSKIKIDGAEYEVDAHYVLIDHGTTKEMTIELFDKKDNDYQLRYFSDQVETSLEFYKLEEIVYNRIGIKKIEW